MERSYKPVTWGVAALALAGAAGQFLDAQTVRQYQDSISKLDRRLASGSVTLDFTGKNGYLPSLLKQLDINTDSQILVFSKTSFQQELIHPQKPRALYFNDDAIVSFVQDAPLYEFVSLEPSEGLLFFTMEQTKTDSPRFKSERGSCTFCHGPINKFAQGVMVATVFPAPDGKPHFPPGELFRLTDHRSPFSERWGGYYVTGTHGGIQHRGNAFAPDKNQPDKLDTSNSSNITSLEDRFDTSKYPAPTSDIVALMTFEHQTMFLNILTSLGAQFRASETFPLPEEQLDAEVDRLVSYMLFIGETKLDSPIRGVSTFTETFAKRGPRDKQGRSLRDFDLNTRMFKYPLSYMIYSAGFDGLSLAAREKIYRRLYDVLIGKVADGGYEQLSPELRRELLEILVETKPGLPAFFKL